jgi:hypothetical protein
LASTSKKTPSVTVSGRRTEWNMCPDLEQRRFGASRVASPLQTQQLVQVKPQWANTRGNPHRKCR